MTPEEKTLLLSTARILRAHMKDHICGDKEKFALENIEYLNESLATYETLSSSEIINETSLPVLTDGQGTFSDEKSS